MKDAENRRFYHRVNADNTIDSICLRCFLTTTRANIGSHAGGQTGDRRGTDGTFATLKCVGTDIVPGRWAQAPYHDVVHHGHGAPTEFGERARDGEQQDGRLCNALWRLHRSYSLCLAVSRSSFSPLLILAACRCRWATGSSGPPSLSSSMSSFNFSSRTCSTCG
jgi:hypothetical protein